MINTYNESSLHAQIKDWYLRSGDEVEKKVAGYIVDLVRNDRLIEIQTANFSAIKKKLLKLLPNYKVTLVYPIAQLKWIVQLDENGKLQYRRRSPRIGRPVDLFSELVRLPELISHPHFSLEVLMCELEEIRLADGKGSWRRKGKSISDRKLIKVIEHIKLDSALQILELLPLDIPEPFLARNLAGKLKVNLQSGQRIAYSLRKMGAIKRIGKKGNAYLYRRVRTDFRPGDHYQMLLDRLSESSAVIGKENYYHSVVFVPFVEIDNTQYLLFQKRSDNIRQPGEICFPGGGVDPFKDRKIEDTAIRETREELGISDEKLEIGGYLGVVINPLGALVDVVIGKLNIEDINQIDFNRNEVDQVFLVPLDFFQQNDPEEFRLEYQLHSTIEKENGEEQVLFPAKNLGLPEKYWRTWSGKQRKIYVYKFEDRVIWGLTAEIVRALINRINLQ
jgi:8-oxo-dGTP pyrophosphatase MutT (NUDIX family)